MLTLCRCRVCHVHFVVNRFTLRNIQLSHSKRQYCSTKWLWLHWIRQPSVTLKVTFHSAFIVVFCWSLTFSDSVGTEDSSSRFTFVSQKKSWMEAQSYCRTHYTDLASVRNRDENEQIKMMIQEGQAWIGLFRGAWKWLDGTPYLLKKWAPNAPTTQASASCVLFNRDEWVNHICSDNHHFICYSGEFLSAYFTVTTKF